MRNKILVVAVMLVSVIFFSTLCYAGTTGKIAGTIKDKETGEPLVGANVLIIGTNYGAATDANGDYYIINLPPGRYDVKAMMIGYKAIVQTSVQVIVDHTTRIDFELESTVIEGEVVEVTAQRPLIEKDVTSSTVVTTGEQIDRLPVLTYQEVMTISPGFIERGTGLNRSINVRGGRTGELSYMIDGFYVEDPLMGGMGSDVTSVGISEMAVLLGTFNAEYGEAMSGVLNIITKEGGSVYNGRLRMLTDKYVNPHEYKYIYKRLNENGQWIRVIDGDTALVADVGTAPATPGQNKFDPAYWEIRDKKVDDWGTFRTDLYFGGPIPFLGKKNTFFVSGDAYNTNTYLGWTGQPYRHERRGNAKVVLRPLNAIKLTFGAVGARERYKNYSHTNKYVPQNTGTHYDKNYMFNATFTHTLSPSTFYEVKASVFNSHRMYYKYKAEDFFSGYYNGEWQILDENGNYTGMANISPPDEEYEFDHIFFDTADSVWTSGGGPEWENRENKITSGKFNLTSQVTKTHQIKLGLELKQVDIYYHDVYAPYSAAPDVWKFHHKPIEGSAYLQDKMEFESWGMVVNAGLRLDYMDTKAKYIFDPRQPTAEYVTDPLTGEKVKNLQEAEKKLYVSPRLGFAHPVMDKAVLHFAYGHFYQIPQYIRLFYAENEDNPYYPFPDMSINGIYTRLGNANLKPEKTIAYELGVETKISEDIALDVTLYFRNIYDYVALRRYQGVPVQYHRFTNLDYANAKGIEITLKKRFTGFFGGQINYSLSKAEGNAPNVTAHFNDWYSFSVYGTYPPKKMITMDWDQTHTINFVLDFGKPGKWSVNVIGNYGSGLPYTPLSSRGLRIDEPMSARMPWTMNVDLRAQRFFKVSGFEVVAYADVSNVFNKRNVLSVFGDTGLPDATTDWDDTQDFVKRPYNFSAPRSLLLGLSVGF